MGKDKVRVVDYWYALVPDQAGSGNEVLQRLAKARVDLLAFLAFPSAGGKAQVDLFPAEPAKFEVAAKAAGVTLASGRKRAILVEGTDRVGAASEHTARLAAKGIHAVAGTAVATPGGGYGFLLWTKQDDVDAAARTLSA
jgi:hypothetical protein